jgi:hypothetical protein
LVTTAESTDKTRLFAIGLLFFGVAGGTCANTEPVRQQKDTINVKYLFMLMILKSCKDFNRRTCSLQTGWYQVPLSGNYNTNLFFVLLQWFPDAVEEYYCKKIITNSYSSLRVTHKLTLSLKPKVLSEEKDKIWLMTYD